MLHFFHIQGPVRRCCFANFLLMLLFTSCTNTNTGWQKLDFGVFTISTPPGWTKFEEQGIDSYIGGLTNGKDRLSFDFGKYSPVINYDIPSHHLYAQDSINGFIATIQIPAIDGVGSVEISFEDLPNSNKLFMAGHNIIGTETIVKMFHSITFKKSGRSKNKHSGIASFGKYPPDFGETVYQNKCAACHKKDRDYSGPALSDELFSARTTDWYYSFFTDRANLPIDSLYTANKQAFNGLSCMQLTGWNKQDIEQLISYFKFTH